MICGGQKSLLKKDDVIKKIKQRFVKKGLIKYSLVTLIYIQIFISHVLKKITLLRVNG